MARQCNWQLRARSRCTGAEELVIEPHGCVVAVSAVGMNVIKHAFALLMVVSGVLLPPASVQAEPACQWPDDGSLDAVIPVAAADGSYASGVVVGEDRVLTAAHAVSFGVEVYVGVDDRFRAAELLMIDNANDLAILSVDTGGIKPLPISSTDPEVSQPVWAVGFPRAQAKTTSAGVFQRKSRGALHTSAPIDSGQSGGGLLSCHNGAYQLAGMLRGFGAYLKGDEYIKLDNHSVSVASATIQRFVDLRYTIQ